MLVSSWFVPFCLDQEEHPSEFLQRKKTLPNRILFPLTILAEEEKVRFGGIPSLPSMREPAQVNTEKNNGTCGLHPLFQNAIQIGALEIRTRSEDEARPAICWVQLFT